MRYTDVWTRLDRTLTTAEPNWRPEPFRLVCSPSDAWITPLHRAALDLSSLDHSRLKNDPVALQEWLADCDASLLDLAEIVQSMPSSDVRTSPPTRRTQPRAANNVPGRKWAQVEAFAKLFEQGTAASHAIDAAPPIVDWCSGKGHLARWLYSCGCCSSANCVELDANLCASGRALSSNLPIQFYQRDVLSSGPLPSRLRGAEYTHTALHACGELHRSVLRHASGERANRIVVVPCCYEKHGNEAFAPLSAHAGRSTALRFSRSDLHLATADGVVTAKRRDAVLREREQSWRLGFECWRRDQAALPSAADDRGGRSDDAQAGMMTEPALAVPSAPSRLLAADDFSAFCSFCVSADGRTLDARRLLAPALAATLASPRGASQLREYEAQGQALRLRVEKLELVRTAFQRPMELWLACDLAMFLEESGYRVEMRQLCERAVTPRNIALVAQMQIATPR